MPYAGGESLFSVSAAAATRPEGTGDLARGNHAEFPQLAAVSQAPVLDQKDSLGNKDAASTTLSSSILVLLFRSTGWHNCQNSWFHAPCHYCRLPVDPSGPGTVHGIGVHNLPSTCWTSNRLIYLEIADLCSSTTS